VRFDLLESGVEWLDGRFTGTNTKCLSWAVLSDRYNSGRKLIVINFHGAVASNKYAGMENMTKDELTAQATAWKIDNIHQLQRKIAALEETFGQAPVFVTGDYNTSYGAEPYKLMASYGYLDAEFNAVTSAMSGYKSTHTMGKKPASGKSIDHIFYSPDRGITPYVHAFGMRQSDLDATDHLPLYVDFAIAP
jgi:endonuclease/exonuclease/phosphatase (EEP) superfamily protein YafD